MKYFLLGVVLFVLLLPPARAQGADEASSGNTKTATGVFWKSDFEDGTLGIPRVWFGGHGGDHPDCLRVVKGGPVAHGLYALDIHVHPDDTTVRSDKAEFKNRDELNQGATNDLLSSFARTGSRLGQTTFYRVAYYFPEDLNPNRNGFNIITQFHPAGGGPPPCLEIDINAKKQPYELEVKPRGGQSRHADLLVLSAGEIPKQPAWVELIFGVHWAVDKTGWVEVWRRDGLSGSWNNVVPRTAAGTLYGDAKPAGAYMKLGYYRGPDGKIGKAKTPWPQISHLIIDNVMAGDSLEAVRNEDPK
jgi:hypothetical protein